MFIAIHLLLAPNLLCSQSGLSREQIYASLAGEWTGTLENRDFPTHERVVLPAWLEVKAAADQDSLRCSYTYDDGPPKTVTEFSTIATDGAGRQYPITSDGDHSSEVYQIARAGREKAIQFLLVGTGNENGKLVEVRIEIKVDRKFASAHERDAGSWAGVYPSGGLHGYAAYAWDEALQERRTAPTIGWR